MKSTWSRKFWKNRIQDALVSETKIVRRQNKLNSFGNLIGKSSQAPVFETTSTRFEFVSRKSKSYVWNRSRDWGPIYFTFFESLSFLLTAWQLSLSFSALPSKRPTAPDNSKQLSRNTTAKHGRTFIDRKQFSFVEISMYIIILTTQFFLDFVVASNIPIHTFSQRTDAYFAVMYFLVSRVHTHIYTYKKDFLNS